MASKSMIVIGLLLVLLGLGMLMDLLTLPLLSNSVGILIIIIGAGLFLVGLLVKKKM
jgi:hypothetical protein